MKKIIEVTNRPAQEIAINGVNYGTTPARHREDSYELVPHQAGDATGKNPVTGGAAVFAESGEIRVLVSRIELDDTDTRPDGWFRIVE